MNQGPTRWAAAVLCAAMGCADGGGPGPAVPVPIEPGSQFSLKVGGWAQARDGALRIGFDAVTADSRCPKGVQCIRAGDAAVRIWWQQGDGARQVHELRVGAGLSQTLRVAGRELRIERLDPYPVAGRSIEPSDYTATLNWGGAAEAAPER